MVATTRYTQIGSIISSVVARAPYDPTKPVCKDMRPDEKNKIKPR